MELPARFPPGTLFWSAHRGTVPVTIGGAGGFIVAAWDGDKPRSFPGKDVVEHGQPITERQFRELVVKAHAALVEFRERSARLAQELCDNLNRNVMAEAARDAQPEVMAERLAAEAIRRAQLRARRGSFNAPPGPAAHP